MTLLIHSQLITRFQAIASLLGNAYDGLCYDDAVQYDSMPELVSNINWKLLIETGSVLWVSAVGFSLVDTVNSSINFFVGIGTGPFSCISFIFEV